jgi:hypothetical protein
MKPHQKYYLDACQTLGKTPVPELEDCSDNDKVSSDAYDRLVICIRVMNMVDGKIWIPVYNGTENHYYAAVRPNESGFGFSRTCYDCWIALTTVGSRLEYRSRDLYDKGFKLLKPYYENYHAPINQ